MGINQFRPTIFLTAKFKIKAGHILNFLFLRLSFFFFFLPTRQTREKRIVLQIQKYKGNHAENQISQFRLDYIKSHVYLTPRTKPYKSTTQIAAQNCAKATHLQAWSKKRKNDWIIIQRNDRLRDTLLQQKAWRSSNKMAPTWNWFVVLTKQSWRHCDRCYSFYVQQWALS